MKTARENGWWKTFLHISSVSFFYIHFFFFFVHCQTKWKKMKKYANFHLSIAFISRSALSFSNPFHSKNQWIFTDNREKNNSVSNFKFHLRIQIQRCTCWLFIHILCEKNSKNFYCRKRKRRCQGWNEAFSAVKWGRWLVMSSQTRQQPLLSIVSLLTQQQTKTVRGIIVQWYAIYFLIKGKFQAFKNHFTTRGGKKILTRGL